MAERNCECLRPEDPLVSPITTAIFEKFEVESVLPGSAGDLIDPPRTGEAISEVIYSGLGKGRRKRCDRHKPDWIPVSVIRIRTVCAA